MYQAIAETPIGTFVAVCSTVEAARDEVAIMMHDRIGTLGRAFCDLASELSAMKNRIHGGHEMAFSMQDFGRFYIVELQPDADRSA